MNGYSDKPCPCCQRVRLPALDLGGYYIDGRRVCGFCWDERGKYVG